MDLLTYQSASEKDYFFQAANCYSHGDVEGAIGYLVGLAETLQIKLPRRPLPKPSSLDNTRTLGRHYFNCLRIISSHKGKTIVDVRQSYATPMKVRAAGQQQAASGQSVKAQGAKSAN